MSDQGVREIQLSGKQLVFLFMASVVVAVGIFLLGVSVGRGVRSAGGEAAPADMAAARETAPPAEMPPPTETTPVDLGYHDQLQGQTPPPAKPVDLPAPVADAPDTPASSPASPVRASEPAPSAVKPAAPPAARAAQPPAGRGWTIQVGAFRSRENADRQVGQLKGRGFPAYVDPAGQSGSLVKVFVGPYADRAEADRAAGRLQREQGLKPLVSR